MTGRKRKITEIIEEKIRKYDRIFFSFIFHPKGKSKKLNINWEKEENWKNINKKDKKKRKNKKIKEGRKTELKIKKNG